MYVVATAGHVDHGKSTLVRALTGMEPDRLADERRRGMTIDLGFAWTDIDARTIAFVDVPGHERFVTTMLAGVGAAPAVMLVVAADEGWKPQTEEHLRVVASLGIRDLLLVVTKSDLAQAGPAVAEAHRRLVGRGFRDVPHVCVSGTRGNGLVDLRRALVRLVDGLPTPDPLAPVRLWVDRVFTVRGAGTVVTGTLPAGTLRVGDRLVAEPGGEPVTVRRLESLRAAYDEVGSVARVAVNVRGPGVEGLGRGAALVTPQAWTRTRTVDVVCSGSVDIVARVTVHLGSAAVPARVRPLGGRAFRLSLDTPLPLHVGDRLLLREPSSRSVVAVDVADLDPAPLRRRGDAMRLAESLRVPTADEEVHRRGIVDATTLLRGGFRAEPTRAVQVGRWWVHAERWSELLAALPAAVGDGVTKAELGRRLGVPTDEIVDALVTAAAGLTLRDGWVEPTSRAGDEDSSLAPLLARLGEDPLDAPDRTELGGLDAKALARAARESRVLRLRDGLYVGPDAVAHAVVRLSALPQPFTVSAARAALGTSRRVAVPLLEHLDAQRQTVRLPDGTRRLVHPATPGGPTT